MNFRKQAGMTLWGMGLVLVVVGFFMLLTLKLLPPYLESYKVRSALESLQRLSDTAALSREAIMDGLQKRFDIEDVENVNLREALKIEPQLNGRGRVVRVAYQVRVPIAYNVSALLDFDHSIQVAGGE